MRVLKFLFTSVVTVLILGGITWLVAREVLLFMGLSKVRSSLTTMRRISGDTSSYLQDCYKKGIIDPNSPLIGSVQLRFTSQTEYVVEVICAQFQLEPIIVAEEELPYFVKKIPGESGIVWGEGLSGVALGVWGRSRAITVENLEVKYAQYNDETFLGVGPQTSCRGYGFTCCQLESSAGQGDLIEGVTDCPRSCFSSCSVRPVVLSFFTQPFFEPQTRVLSIAAGEAVEFAYVVDVVPAGGSVSIEYGDGTAAEKLTTPAGTFNHTFECQSGSCRYPVSLTVQTSQGVVSAATPISKIEVMVTR